MERTIEYMNALESGAMFHGVEMVKFSTDGNDAFEARLVASTQLKTQKRRAEVASEARFLEQLEDSSYRSALTELFAACSALGLWRRAQFGSLVSRIGPALRPCVII